MSFSLYGTVTIRLTTQTYNAGLCGHEDVKEILIAYLGQKLSYSEEVEFEIRSCRLISGPWRGGNGKFKTEFEVEYELPRLNIHSKI